MTTQTLAYNLGRNRHVRLADFQDEALQRLARQEGCSVSDLIRRALIQTFSLPTEATIPVQMPEKGSVIPQNEERADPENVTAEATP